MNYNWNLLAIRLPDIDRSKLNIAVKRERRRSKYDWTAVDWAKTDREIAEILGCKWYTVYAKRAQLGLRVRVNRTPEFLAAVDWTKQDVVITRELGVAAGTVSAKRKLLGIPRSPDWHKGGGVPPKVDYTAIDWTKRDIELASIYGLSRERMRQIRGMVNAPESSHKWWSESSIEIEKEVLADPSKFADLTLNQFKTKLGIGDRIADRILAKAGLKLKDRVGSTFDDADFRLGDRILAIIWGLKYPSAFTQIRVRRKKGLAKWNAVRCEDREQPEYHAAIREEIARRNSPLTVDDVLRGARDRRGGRPASYDPSKWNLEIGDNILCRIYGVKEASLKRKDRGWPGSKYNSRLDLYLPEYRTVVEAEIARAGTGKTFEEVHAPLIAMRNRLRRGLRNERWNQCNEKGPNGWNCLREKNHEGKHVAQDFHNGIGSVEWSESGSITIPRDELRYLFSAARLYHFSECNDQEVKKLSDRELELFRDGG